MLPLWTPSFSLWPFCFVFCCRPVFLPTLFWETHEEPKKVTKKLSRKAFFIFQGQSGGPLGTPATDSRHLIRMLCQRDLESLSLLVTWSP